jgi:hypothetical protein
MVALGDGRSSRRRSASSDTQANDYPVFIWISQFQDIRCDLYTYFPGPS